MSISQTTIVMWRHRGHELVRLLVVGVLLAAAVLKTHQLLTEPILGKGFLYSRWILIGLVELEFFFGLWILTGRAAQLTWRLATMCFVLFACVSAYKAIGGEASCGCFGRLQVNPWITMTFDLAMLAALLALPPAESNAPGHMVRIPLRVFATVVVAIGLPALVAMTYFWPPTASPANGVTIAGDNWVIAEPQRWPGKRFPLLDQIDVGERLAAGRWLLVFYHPGCPQCEELIDRYRNWQQARVAGAESAKVAFIEVPDAEQSHSIDFSGTRCLLGSLDRSRRWFVPTPTILVLQEGTVRTVAQQEGPALFFRMLDQVQRSPGSSHEGHMVASPP